MCLGKHWCSHVSTIRGVAPVNTCTYGAGTTQTLSSRGQRQTNSGGQTLWEHIRNLRCMAVVQMRRLSSEDNNCASTVHALCYILELHYFLEGNTALSIIHSAVLTLHIKILNTKIRSAYKIWPIVGD